MKISAVRLRTMPGVSVKWLLICLCFFCQNCGQTNKKSAKPGVAISFDDHFINEWYALRPLFGKYHAKVTFYITCPDSLNEDEIFKLKTLQADGHEIAYHGTIHGRSTELIAASGPEGYLSTEIRPGLEHMRQAGFFPTSYAHPGGNHNAQVDSVLHTEGFKILRDVAISRREMFGIPLYTIAPRLMNGIYYDFDKRTEVEALLIDTSARLTKGEVRDALSRAQEERRAVMLFGHEPLSANPREGAYGFDIQFLEYILQEASQMKLQFYTMSELADQ